MTTVDSLDTVDPDDVIAELEAAHTNLEEAEATIEAAGESELRQLADVYDRFTDLLDEYEVPASGSGRETFESYIDFESELVDFIERLPADLPQRAAFEQAESVLDKRRLSTDDFDRARDELGPVVERVALLNRREAALKEYRSARHDVESRLRSINRKLGELEDLLRFAEVDFDAPIKRLQDPIDHYNEAVMEAFQSFRSTTATRDVLEFIDVTQRYPLVDFAKPPTDMVTYLRDRPVGDEPIPRLLEFAEFSASKLDHYVNDPSTFRARVSGNRTYLTRLDAEPLTLSWPPPSADELRWLVRELVAVVDRFADERVVRQLHHIRDLYQNRDEYERLRRAAVASASLDEAQRQRLASGDITHTRDRLTGARKELEAALDRYPTR